MVFLCRVFSFLKDKMSYGLQGLQGPQGPPGVTGGTGPTGWQGVQGPQGTPFGPTGLPFYNSTTRLSLSGVTGSAATILYPTAASSTTYYTISGTSPTITGITLPSSTTGLSAGSFWIFRNNTGSSLTLSLTNGTAVYGGLSAASSVVIASGNSLSLVYSGGGTSYIAF